MASEGVAAFSTSAMPWVFAADGDAENSTKLRIGTSFREPPPNPAAPPSPRCTSTKQLFLQGFLMKSTASLEES
jgi:hypothetical protein